MKAFNYQTQQWVSGPEACKLSFNQLLQELLLLRGPEGERYAKFCGITDRASAISALDQQAKALLG